MTPRTDIQALRGLAVLLVVLQHARAGFVPAGFLGVDIFFVISGFLITGMLANYVAQGGIRFAAFYFRRAKRLLPAAYVTFVITAVLAYFLLDAAEWNDFTRQLTGAVTFTANFVLLQQTGYFAGAAELKPLLHVWSLAVEEQYYLLLPAALTLVPRRYWFPGSVLVLLMSLVLCIAWTFSHPDAAFYLLPARAWELAIGSLVALWTTRGGRANAIVSVLFLPCLLALFLVPLVPLDAPIFVNIALVCSATAVVILRQHPALSGRPIPRAFAKVGDASYSLYLVHWPIFAFINNVYAGDPSFGTPGSIVLIGGVVLALVLGYLLYRWVELPIRRAKPAFRKTWVVAAVATSTVLVLAPPGIVAWSNTIANPKGPAVDYAALRRDNVGFGPVCDTYDRFAPLSSCESAPRPELMVWGDSFAMHLVAGLTATTRGGVLQATKSACAPLLGTAQIMGRYNRDYAEHCLAFNRSVIDYLVATPSIKVVVLSSSFYPYFDPERTLLREVEGKLLEERPDEDAAAAAIRATVERLRALGKRVVIVAPPPSNGFDFTHCLERKATNRTLFGRFIDCNIPLAEYRASKRQVLAFLGRVQREADVPVISFDPLLCTRSECVTQLDATIVYRDEGHLSYQGSIAVARAMRLGDLVEKAAR